MTKQTKIKKVFPKLRWNVVVHDFNKKGFSEYNVLQTDLMEKILKLIKEPYDYIMLADTVRRWAMHRYWCKAEYEIVITDLWGKSEKKVDVWSQIELNFDRLVEYLIKELGL